MHTALCLVALASVAYSQLINLDAIALDFAPPELVKAPINVQSNIPAASTPSPITPLQSVSAKKREFVEKRDGDCSPYPTGSGPVPSPDTPSGFQSDVDFAAMANEAPTPDGYSLVFNNLSASLQASNYMGLYTLTSYDTLTCASKCDQANCSAFNVYLERDPTVNVNAQNCPNPPSTTNYKCTLWGAPVSFEEATNSGQYQDSFQVVIAGSNGYNKNSPPPPVSCYSGPQELGGAINAPSSSGSYMGYQYFPFSQSQGYDPQTCADACDAQTLYDSQHPAADGSFMSCVFFNTYVLSKNAIPQGIYCSMYNNTWDTSYGTNYGQYRGSDRYTVSESYSYIETCNDPKQPPVSSVSSSSQVSSATSAASSTSSPSSSLAASSKSSSSVVTTFSSVGSSTISPSTSSSASTYTPNPSCDPDPNNLVQNYDFDCGLAPWVTDIGFPQGSFSIVGRALQYYGSGPYIPHGPKPPSVSQQIAVTVGQAYTLTFRSYFDYCSGQGTIEVLFNGYSGYTVTDCQFTAGLFQNNTVTYIASKSPLVLEFDFENTEWYTSSMAIMIDEVYLVAGTAQSSISHVTSNLPSTTRVPSTTVSTTAASSTSACNSASPGLQNGGFESGTIKSWVAMDGAGSSTSSIVSPGSTLAGGGNYAFAAKLLSPDSFYNPNIISSNLYQSLTTCVGTNYSVTADYNFVSVGDGSCSFGLQNGSPANSSVSVPGVWHRMTATFVAGSYADAVVFALSCSKPGTIEVDSVNVTRTAAGNAS